MSEERINRLEVIAERHDNDIHRIAQSLEKLVEQGEKTNQILQDSILKDVQINARIDRMESALSSQIKSNGQAIERAHKRNDKIDAIINRLAWTVITFVIIGLIGSVIKFGG